MVSRLTVICSFEFTAVYIVDYKMFFFSQKSTFFGFLNGNGHMSTKGIVQKMINLTSSYM